MDSTAVMLFPEWIFFFSLKLLVSEANPEPFTQRGTNTQPAYSD